MLRGAKNRRIYQMPTNNAKDTKTKSVFMEKSLNFFGLDCFLL